MPSLTLMPQLADAVDADKCVERMAAKVETVACASAHTIRRITSSTVTRVYQMMN